MPVKSQADRDRELEMGRQGTPFRWWFGAPGVAIRRKWVAVRHVFAGRAATFDLDRLGGRKRVDPARLEHVAQLMLAGLVIEGALSARQLRIQRWRTEHIQRHPAITPHVGDVGARWSGEVGEDRADQETEIPGMQGWWRHIATTAERHTYRTLTEREVIDVEDGHVSFVARPVFGREGVAIDLIRPQDVGNALRLGPARQRHRVPLARWQAWARVAWSPRGGLVVPTEVRREPR